LIINPEERSKRIKMFRDSNYKILQKYDLWKALDFEKMIKIVQRHDEDNFTKYIKLLYGYVDPSEMNETIKNLYIEFKGFINSVFSLPKFNKVSKVQ
jgi:hypothetical protein